MTLRDDKSWFQEVLGKFQGMVVGYPTSVVGPGGTQLFWASKCSYGCHMTPIYDTSRLQGVLGYFQGAVVA